MKLWLGSLGSVIFSSISLLFCLSFHFSFAPAQQFFSRLKLFKNFPKESLPTLDQEAVDVDDSIEDKITKNTNSSLPFIKKWNFPWQRKENDEDLLFGDVSKNVAEKPIQTSKTKSNSSGDKPITPVKTVD